MWKPSETPKNGVFRPDGISGRHRLSNNEFGILKNDTRAIGADMI